MVGFVRLSKMPQTPCRTIRKRCYKNFQKEDFLNDLQNENWLEVYSHLDVENAVRCFTKKFKVILDKHAPWRIIQQRKFFIPWISNEAKQLMGQRDFWKKRAKSLACNGIGGISSQDEVEAWRQYKYFRNKVNNIKKNDEYKYKRETVSLVLDDSPRMWSTVKSFMGWKKTTSPRQIIDDNILYSKAYDIAKLMNNYFVNKIKNLSNQSVNVFPNYQGCHMAMRSKSCRMYLQHVTIQNVIKIIKGLKSSKSLSVDELDSFSLKIAAEIVGPVVHHLISLSIMQNKFPDTWKYAKVLPIHKKGNVYDKKNYRPVSILSPISKVLERVVYDQLYNYFSNNKIFHQNSMGFRKNRSTLTALLQMYDRWVRASDNGNVSLAVLLDLSAAFDLVSPEILLEKLRIYGVHRDCLSWLKSYLLERRQGVWIDNVLSDWESLEVGVPQGSILGPLLFVIFANDLPFTLSCDLDTYADDSTLTSSKSSVMELNLEMNENCELVNKWMSENHLCLNADKTNLLIAGTQRRLHCINRDALSISMDSVHLNETGRGVETLLGVRIMSNLKWREHVLNLKSRLQSRLCGIQKLRNVLPTSKLKLVAEGVFTSILYYCIPLWGA